MSLSYKNLLTHSFPYTAKTRIKTPPSLLPEQSKTEQRYIPPSPFLTLEISFLQKHGRNNFFQSFSKIKETWVC